MNEIMTLRSWSAAKKNKAAINTITRTMIVDTTVSRRDGQTTFAVSERTCWRNVKGLVFEAIIFPRLYGAVSYHAKRAAQFIWHSYRSNLKTTSLKSKKTTNFAAINRIASHGGCFDHLGVRRNDYK